MVPSSAVHPPLSIARLRRPWREAPCQPNFFCGTNPFSHPAALAAAPTLRYNLSLATLPHRSIP
jgi:hypothetical protein